MRKTPQQKNQHHYPRRAVIIPNHCSNSLTVTGPGSEDFFAKVETFAAAEEDNNFIGSFIPMPAELKDIHSGSTTIDGVVVKKWRIIDNESVAVSDIDLTLLADLYGTADWYDWCVANWGTKWGAYDVDYDGKACIRFDSAWSPPIPAIRTISEMFPTATFELAFAEGGSCFYGSQTIQNGVVVDGFERDEPDEFWDEHALDENGDPEMMLTDECRDFIEAHGLHTGG